MSFTADEPPRRGWFITLEGGEGTGKSTQARRLADRLGRQGIATLVTREPGGTPLAETFRAALLSGGIAPFGAAAEALVFSGARIDHIDRKIGPALRAGTTVICDRFIDSTRAYQGSVGAVDATLIDGLERVVVGPLRPDLTFVLDMPSAAGLARAAARRGAGEGADRFETQDLAFHEALRAAFLAIAAREPARVHVIDASRSPKAVSSAIWAIVSARLRPGKSAKRRRGAPA